MQRSLRYPRGWFSATLEPVRIALYSDLHLEFAPFVPPERGVDLVVLAGDIGTKLQGLRFAEKLASRCPVLYVLGNHEYYGSHTQLVHKLRSEAPPRVHVLENAELVLDGVRFLGCTLWTDFELGASPGLARSEAMNLMSDYVSIRSAESGFKHLKPVHTFRKHLESRAFLEAKLNEPFAGKTVVVTHHAPSAQSLVPHERDQPIAAAYASALDALVAASRAAFWLHGHTHHNVDYTIGATRVLTNQRGYVSEPAAGFRPELVLEL